MLWDCKKTNSMAGWDEEEEEGEQEDEDEVTISVVCMLGKLTSDAAKRS